MNFESYPLCFEFDFLRAKNTLSNQLSRTHTVVKNSMPINVLKKCLKMSVHITPFLPMMLELKMHLFLSF